MSAKARTDDIPLTKVVLYKHGMGYFERCGKVAGPTTIDLYCPQAAIDDMLKSLLILNLGGGRTGAATYDSSKTEDMRFAEFGIDIRGCRGLVDLIGLLKGTPVTITSSGQTLSARIVGQDTIEQSVGDKVIRENQLVLFTTDGVIKTANFSSISSLKIEDQAIAAELTEQLELLFDAAKKKDRKRLTISVEGEDSRELFIAYSIPSPIWKTSYRIVFVPDGSLLLQGMAIVDNVQEEDWNNVQIVLVSAAPISFIQPLYDPIQPPRAIIAGQGIVSAGPVSAERGQRLDAAAEPRKMNKALGAPRPAPQGAAPPGAVWGSANFDIGAAAAAPYTVAGAMQQQFESGQLPVEAEAIGEMFEYKISDPVTVPRNSSALIPLVQKTIEGERVSLYNAVKNSKFPYSAVRLKNTTELTLEAGPVTVMEEHAYAGEALLDVLKPGDIRMLPYALDQGCHVIVRVDAGRKPVWRVRASGGIIYMDYREQYRTTYSLENLADAPKLVFVEHPVVAGRRFAENSEPFETSQHCYRFKVQLDPLKTQALEVVEQSDATTYLRIDTVEAIDTRQLDWLVQQNYLDKAFLTFLQRLMNERAEVLDLLDQQKTVEAQIAQFKSDQERARENIKSLGTADTRYRQSIDEAEDRIRHSVGTLNDLQKALSERQKKFAELMRAELTSEIENAAAARR